MSNISTFIRMRPLNVGCLDTFQHMSHRAADLLNSDTSFHVAMAKPDAYVSAARVAPYTCEFGSDTLLKIEARFQFILSDGSPYDPETGTVDDDTNVYILQSLTNWSWR